MLGLIKLYLLNCIYVLDVLVNVLVGGDRRDTISSRLGKGKKANKPVHTVLASIVDFIFLIVFKDTDHCVRNIEYIDDRYSLSTYLKNKKGA